MLSTKQCPLAQILATKWSPETLHQNRVLVTEQAPHIETRTGRTGPNPDFYLSFKDPFILMFYIHPVTATDLKGKGSRAL